VTHTAPPALGTLLEQYRAVRRASAWLCEPLALEDYVPQSMPDASPVKWHLAHTTWFFETMVLQPTVPGFRPFDPQFVYMFNSYYNAVGPQYSRPHRGLVTRPTVDRVRAYRAHVDAQMEELIERAVRLGTELPEAVIVLGLNHEQQHQELIVTDLKHLLSFNPQRPVYRADGRADGRTDGRVAEPLGWIDYAGGLRDIGFAGEGFAFDNESPRHRVYLEPFQLGSRLVTAGEYRQFMADGGYQRPDLWLSDGWKVVNERGWRAPLYWEPVDGGWFQFTLGGFRPVADAEPVTHVSLYEADAYARWAQARLPTEAEWEIAAADAPIGGNFVEQGLFHPAPTPVRSGSAPPVSSAGTGGDGARQLFGDTWEWTQSPYTAYPGFKPAAGAIGEYNAKFMANQYVLRGGSCATPRSHIRPTYRNFFPADARWQFSGIRLARDV
jgi:ergothioneine biosynthesis protein EgtB